MPDKNILQFFFRGRRREQQKHKSILNVHAIKTAITTTCICFFALAGKAGISLPAFIRDSMVLQRDVPVKIWGWAQPKEKIIVGWNGRKYGTTTSAEGEWSVILQPCSAGGPFTMRISGKSTVELKEILVGDVWLCAGQSNMVHQMQLHNITYAADIANAHYPQVRQFLVANTNNLQNPQKHLPAAFWKPATPEAIAQFSAVAWFFAQQIYEKYHIPIGIINASVGGTPIEAWTSERGLTSFADIQTIIAKNKDSAYINKQNRIAKGFIDEHPKPADNGLLEEKTWYDTSYIAKDWKHINIPGYWEDQGIKDLDGVVWYRREIDVPSSMTGKPGKLFLGRIVDADVLYINGKEIGHTGYQYPQRRYVIDAAILRPGKNLFVIKVTNNEGKGGFVPDKPYYVKAGDEVLDIKGEWQYKVGAVYPPVVNQPPTLSAQNQPTALFNAMIAPLVGFAIKGVLWYQGESNAGNPQAYKKLLPALIADWRHQWQQDNLPFIYVQLPNFKEADYLPSESSWAILRQAQLNTLKIPHTAMAVAIDLGEWNDIHPDNKKSVGERLALAAEKLVYNDQQVIASGPLYESAAISGNKIIISFSNTGSGLTTNDAAMPANFAIAGMDKKFVWAKTKIENNKIIAWNDDIANPMFVRYAWADNPCCANLFNKEGLPASPFSTEEW